MNCASWSCTERSHGRSGFTRRCTLNVPARSSFCTPCASTRSCDGSRSWSACWVASAKGSLLSRHRRQRVHRPGRAVARHRAKRLGVVEERPLAWKARRRLGLLTLHALERHLHARWHKMLPQAPPEGQDGTVLIPQRWHQVTKRLTPLLQEELRPP